MFCLNYSTFHQRITADAQVKPDPNEVRTTISLFLIRPCFNASSSAIGIEAAVVLPKRSMFLMTFSTGMRKFLATIKLILSFA